MFVTSTKIRERKQIMIIFTISQHILIKFRIKINLHNPCPHIRKRKPLVIQSSICWHIKLIKNCYQLFTLSIIQFTRVYSAEWKNIYFVGSWWQSVECGGCQWQEVEWELISTLLHCFILLKAQSPTAGDYDYIPILLRLCTSPRRVATCYG